MDSDIEELYFQKLQELVQDEDKIVTVASLSFDLGISVKISQKLIKKYVEDQRKLNSNDLAITYVLTGLLKSNRGKGVFMVKEDDLDTKQPLFEEKPFKLIYSIQKNKNVDFNVIALVDMFDAAKIREKPLEGSIVSKNCVKRKIKVQSPPPPKTKSVIQPKPGKSTEGSKSVEKPDSSKNSQKTKSSGNIVNLFKAVAAKTNHTNGEKNSTSTASSNKKSGKKNGALSGFLISGATKSQNNVNSKQAVKEEPAHDKKGSSSSNEVQDEISQEDIMEIFTDDFEEEVSQKIKNSGTKTSEKNANLSQAFKEEPLRVKEVSSSCNEVQDKIKPEEIMDVSDDDFEIQKVTNKKNHPVKKAHAETKKPSKKRQRDKSQEKPSKKRKRIVERNDSDSDDLFEKEPDNDDIVDKSDEEPERIPSPVKEKPLLPKNKKRKAVSKTYTDEEGFVVTKTEYVYETASEDENEAPKPPKQEKQEKVEKPRPKVNDKKKAPKNQSTLMSFFKKV